MTAPCDRRVVPPGVTGICERHAHAERLASRLDPRETTLPRTASVTTGSVETPALSASDAAGFSTTVGSPTTTRRSRRRRQHRPGRPVARSIRPPWLRASVVESDSVTCARLVCPTAAPRVDARRSRRRLNQARHERGELPSPLQGNAADWGRRKCTSRDRHHIRIHDGTHLTSS